MRLHPQKKTIKESLLKSPNMIEEKREKRLSLKYTTLAGNISLLMTNCLRTIIAFLPFRWGQIAHERRIEVSS